MKRLSLEERFWPKVIIADAGVCWVWTGSRGKFGHGLIDDRYAGRGWLLAHRISWEMHNGPIPDGLCVCHHCDNPACVNPVHLFLGSRRDNLEDMRSKGRARYSRGDKNGRAVLTNAQVEAIRAEAGALRVAAQKYGISQAHVSRIRSGKRWAHMRMRAE